MASKPRTPSISVLRVYRVYLGGFRRPFFCADVVSSHMWAGDLYLGGKTTYLYIYKILSVQQGRRQIQSTIPHPTLSEHVALPDLDAS